MHNNQLGKILGFKKSLGEVTNSRCLRVFKGIGSLEINKLSYGTIMNRDEELYLKEIPKVWGEEYLTLTELDLSQFDLS